MASVARLSTGLTVLVVNKRELEAVVKLISAYVASEIDDPITPTLRQLFHDFETEGDPK